GLGVAVLADALANDFGVDAGGKHGRVDLSVSAQDATRAQRVATPALSQTSPKRKRTLSSVAACSAGVCEPTASCGTTQKKPSECASRSVDSTQTCVCTPAKTSVRAAVGASCACRSVPVKPL